LLKHIYQSWYLLIRSEFNIPVYASDSLPKHYGYRHSMDTALHAPNPVRIFHRRAGCVHIFTSPELRGLHVGHSDLEQAFALIPEAVSGLVELETGVEGTRSPPIDGAARGICLAI